MRRTLPILFTLISLAAAGYFWNEARAIRAKSEAEISDLQAQLQSAAARPKAQPLPVRSLTERPRAVEPVPSNVNEALKRQVAELNKSIAARDSLIASLRQNAATNSQPGPEPFWQRREKWLENLKTENPTQYEAYVKQEEEARQRTKDSFARKAAHFVNKDTAGMTEEEVAQYNTMLQMLDEAWKLSDQLRAEDIPDEQRRDLLHSMHEIMHGLSPMLTAERDKEFFQVALDLGYKEDDAAQFVTYLTNIIDITSMRSVIQGGRGMGPGGPGWWDSNPTNRQ